jgi:lysophospholipase L1-like esterase
LTSVRTKNADLLAVILVLLLLVSIAATCTWQLYTNSLDQHPDWISTKATLKRGVMGAVAYRTEAMALARNRLDLGAWFGFQEVTYRRPLDLAELGARVRFGPEGYVNVLYDIGPDGFSGVRFSDRADMPSLHFRTDAIGRFVALDTLVPSGTAPNVWHRVSVSFAGPRASVQLDGRPVGAYDRRPGPSRVGFRGGQREGLVDDVELRLTSGTTIRETFTNWRRAPLIALLALAGFAGLAGAVATLARRRSVPWRDLGLGITMAHLVLLVLITILYVYQFERGRTYPILGMRARKDEAYWIGYRQSDVLQDLRRDYGKPAGAAVYRILFLGASQTWGAGATLPEQVWVRQLETLLNAGARGRRFECLNAGVSGLTALTTAALLDSLLPFTPRAVVIDLSNNDIHPASLRENLGRMVDTLARAGIPAVLLLEPNSPERKPTDTWHGDLGAKHDVVRAIGATRGIPVIDLQQYLRERNGTGFLWWDFVHLTDYGQRLVAEKLAVELPGLLEPERRARPSHR